LVEQILPGCTNMHKISEYEALRAKINQPGPPGGEKSFLRGAQIF